MTTIERHRRLHRHRDIFRLGAVVQFLVAGVFGGIGIATSSVPYLAVAALAAAVGVFTVLQLRRSSKVVAELAAERKR